MALAKAQLRFGDHDDAVANAALANRLQPMAPDYYPYIHGLALYAAGRAAEAEGVVAECLLDAPNERNCLRAEAVVLVRLGRPAEAQTTMARLAGLDPDFSLAAERRFQRFGDTPMMDQYLADLASAGAPAGIGRAGLRRREGAAQAVRHGGWAAGQPAWVGLDMRFAFLAFAGLMVAGCTGSDEVSSATEVTIEGCPIGGVETSCVMLVAADGVTYNITAADPKPALDGRAIRLTGTPSGDMDICMQGTTLTRITWS